MFDAKRIFPKSLFRHTVMEGKKLQHAKLKVYTEKCKSQTTAAIDIQKGSTAGLLAHQMELEYCLHRGWCK